MGNKKVSKVRKIYIARLIGRCIIMALSVYVWIFHREEFDVIYGMNFFKEFSVLHLLWGLWLIDMVSQLVPIKTNISLGSEKVFKARFRAVKEKISRERLKEHIVSTTKRAYLVMIVWVLFIGLIGALYYLGLYDETVLLLFSIAFYVCDLICVLVWCPFRLMMGNRCCTTCRIFNWDHFMMFTPVMFVFGFYTMSLFILSVIIFIAWELCVLLHPERFSEMTNVALRCSECTDKLCTQYCQKLRK